jgi:hypothetical protein
MSEIVQPDSRQVSPGDRPSERFPDAVRVPWCAVRSGEHETPVRVAGADEHPFLELACLMPSEHRHRLGVQVELPGPGTAANMVSR